MLLPVNHWLSNPLTESLAEERRGERVGVGGGGVGACVTENKTFISRFIYNFGHKLIVGTLLNKYGAPLPPSTKLACFELKGEK